MRKKDRMVNLDRHKFANIDPSNKAKTDYFLKPVSSGFVYLFPTRKSFIRFEER